ncbi:hypothetical protein FKM82_013147 [Ascaphus truei]
MLCSRGFGGLVFSGSLAMVCRAVNVGIQLFWMVKCSILAGGSLCSRSFCILTCTFSCPCVSLMCPCVRLSVPGTYVHTEMSLQLVFTADFLPAVTAPKGFLP